MTWYKVFMKRSIIGKKNSYNKRYKGLLCFYNIKFKLMATITSNLLREKTKQQSNTKPSLLNQYLAYADRQNKAPLIWYFKTIIAIPCVVMIPAILALGMLTSNYIWFAAVTVLLFFANVIAHIGNAKGRFFVPLYHATIAFMILIPLITYLIK